jgi:hypothetical protein
MIRPLNIEAALDMSDRIREDPPIEPPTPHSLNRDMQRILLF